MDLSLKGTISCSIDPSTNRPIVLQFFYWGHLCLRWTLSFGERHDPKSVTWLSQSDLTCWLKNLSVCPSNRKGFFGWCFFFHWWGYLMMYVWLWYMLVSWRVSTKTIQNLETLLISHNSWCHCEPRRQISQACSGELFPLRPCLFDANAPLAWFKWSMSCRGNRDAVESSHRS